MLESPTILLAGGADTESDVSRALPAGGYHVLRAASSGEALELAESAAVVVVDTSFGGGAAQLCRQLRAHPLTSDLPVVVVYHNGQPELPQPLTDAQVAAGDAASLAQALCHLVPDLLATGETDGGAADLLDFVEGGAFDEEFMTVIWRKPAGETEGDESGWPPPPPEQQPDEDLVQFASNFVGYASSLIEALEDPSRLSGAESQRLNVVARSTPPAAEALLDTVQRAMNKALASMNLEQTKILSSAKNSLYEKLQRLRVLARSFEPGSPGTAEPDPPAAPARSATPPGLPIEERRSTPAQGSGDLRSGTPARGSSAPRSPTPRTMPERRQSGTYPAPGDAPARVRRPSALVELTGEEMALPGSAKKSKLTLAAEAKARLARQEVQSRTQQRVQQRVSAQAVGGARKVHAGVARRESRVPGSTWLWAGIAVVTVVAAALFIGNRLLSRTDASPVATAGPNVPPQMIEVKLSQTAAGIVLRPRAEDQDGDRVTFQVRWFVNGMLVDGERTARLGPERYETGSIVYAEIRPTDGKDHGSPMRSRDHRVEPLRQPPAPGPAPAPAPAPTPP